MRVATAVNDVACDGHEKTAIQVLISWWGSRGLIVRAGLCEVSELISFRFRATHSDTPFRLILFLFIRLECDIH